MNFDEIIDRRGSASLKWDRVDSDVIPLWVADMDFKAPQAVTEALLCRAEHGIYGYTDAGSAYFKALQSWYKNRYRLNLDLDAIIPAPGVVPSLALAAGLFSDPGDGILLMSPVYYPFTETIRDNGRLPVSLSLQLNADGRYIFDPEALERRVRESETAGIKVPLLFFCSPHNPSGTVWTQEELTALLECAKKLDMIVVSDEIHGDFIHGGRQFVSLASFSEYTDRVLVLSSANKTFNLAGLQLSHCIVQNSVLREKLSKKLHAAGFGLYNVFSLIAAETAYRYGEVWLTELLAYLAGNISMTLTMLNIPDIGIQAYNCEGGYLVWADASGLIKRRRIKNDKSLVYQLESEAGIKLIPGSIFGPEGNGFIRINAACPRSLLKEGLERLLGWAAS